VPVSALTNHRRYRRFAGWVSADVEWRPVDCLVGFNKMPGLDVYYAADPCFMARAAQRSRAYRVTERYRRSIAAERAVFGPEAGAEILLVSPGGQEAFARCYGTPPERFHLLPPEIAADRIAPRDEGAIRSAVRAALGVGDDGHLVLLIGSGFKTKGLDRALRALAALPPPLRAKTHLVAVGQDNPRPYPRLARRLGVGDRFQIFAGRDDVPQLLLGGDLLIHPAYMENTGTILLEAMAAGLPVLATAVCGYASHVARARAGELVEEPFSQATLDRLLATMLTSPSRAAWRQNGIAYAKTLAGLSRARVAVEVIEARALAKRAAGRA
ncbi:MAG: glycosyltransferase family 4 protein, partial [Burkholderiales bacterium]|nr:glycosyltransferase family 4 protein [Burkholderiales bacterium]